MFAARQLVLSMVGRCSEVQKSRSFDQSWWYRSHLHPADSWGRWWVSAGVSSGLQTVGATRQSVLGDHPTLLKAGRGVEDSGVWRRFGASHSLRQGVEVVGVGYPGWHSLLKTRGVGACVGDGVGVSVVVNQMKSTHGKFRSEVVEAVVQIRRNGRWCNMYDVHRWQCGGG